MNQRRFAITRPFASCWWRETKICDCGTYQAAFWRRLAFVVRRMCHQNRTYFVRRRTPIVLFSQSARHNRKSPPGSRSPQRHKRKSSPSEVTERSSKREATHLRSLPSLLVAMSLVPYSAAMMASTLSLASPSSMVRVLVVEQRVVPRRSNRPSPSCAWRR